MITYDDLHSNYIASTFAVEDEALKGIGPRLRQKGLPAIGLRPEEGRFLQCLVACCGARRAIEFGTLGGYSTTWIARGLPAGGRLTTVELNPACVQVARETFARAGIEDRVEQVEGDAFALLPELAGRGPFDFAFIDTAFQEGAGYLALFEWALENVRVGGVIAAHNVFGYGGLFSEDPESQGENMRRFNRRFAEEPGLLSTIFPAGDGMAFGVIRAK